MKANEMFKKLGYENDVSYEREIASRYFKRDEDFGNTFINFWNDKTIDKYSQVGNAYITLDELKAINQKCKELGWIEC